MSDPPVDATGAGLAVFELAPGLWRWTAPHPEWTPEKDGPGGWAQRVASLYYEAAETTVLIDPQTPASGTSDADRFWDALHRDLGRSGLPITVLISNAFHGRSTRQVYQRFAGTVGVEVWVPAPVAQRVACDATRLFAAGDRLPGAITTHGVDGLASPEVAFLIHDHRTLVVADAVIGAGDGTLRLAPESWAEATAAGRVAYRSTFRESIRTWLELEFDALAPSHGEPVLRGARRALAEALAAPAWGDESA